VGFLGDGRTLLLNQDSSDEARRGLFEWDVGTARQVRAWPRTTARGDYSVSTDGRSCAVRAFGAGGTPVAPDFGIVSLIDLGSGEERKIPGKPWVAAEGRFSPDGRLFASPMGPTGAVYATASFEPVRSLTATMHGMAGAAFSPDGSRLAFTMTGFDAVRLLDSESWDQVLVLEANASRLDNAAFSPDGNVLAAMTYWGTLHFWRAPSWEEIAAAEKVQGR
jgi:WD40 repeat protein